ncbi:MAG: arginine--tRNA ligase [Clostridia bacterium]|nr:arginine--tRNA ligase [Clostridia bacterium]
MLDFKNVIAEAISKVVCIEPEEIENYIEIPPDKAMGDYAFPCFKLAKTLRKAPPAIAEEIKEKIEIDNHLISSFEVQGGYLNFFVNKEALVQEVLGEINKLKENYGSSYMGQNQNIIVEYSSPNIAKPFHIGHLRNTIIGNCLYKVYKFLGYNVTGINHLGDYGTQFGKLIEGYKRWGDEYDISKDPINELTKIYIRINDACKEDESILEACRDNFRLLEEGDDYCVELWNWFKEESLKEFQRIYDLLGVKFDSLNGESFYTDKMDEIEEILDKAKVTKMSQGAKIVDLEDKGLGVCIIRKSNGSTIYATRDLAAIKYRADTYHFDKCLYVVAYEQALHFKQIFEVAKYLGIPEKCVNGLEHVQYGMTRLATGKMSTREGTAIKVQDLLDEAISRTTKIIEEKNPEMEEKTENAKKIGIGAIVFNNLSNTIIKDQVFDWDNVLSFQGDTGPYIQYVYVRTKGVLENVGYIPKFEDIDISCLQDEAAIGVVTKLYQFGDMLKSVTERNEPSILAHYLLELAGDYTKFYNEDKVMCEDEKLKNARAYLTFCVQTVIKIGSRLLGMEMPSKM